MTLKAIIPHVLWTILLLRFIPYSQSFDLVSSLLSQTPNLSDKLPLPNLKSLLGSSEAVQKLLQSKGLLPFMSGEAAPKNPMELNRLLAQLKPKQGRFDPQVLDMLSAFDNNYSGQIPSIFGNSHESISRRVPTSTEESGVIWSTTAPTAAINKRQQQSQIPRKTVPNLRNKFSSKFRNKTSTTTTENPESDFDSESNQTLTTAPPTTYINSIPFDHITDPNIRNHRLYDWEFETYKNFTHIDQAEDLMADESDPSEVVVKPSSVSTIIPSGWIPKAGSSHPRGPKRPKNIVEESQLESSGANLLNSVQPGTYVRFPPTDSEEPRPPRERMPLRESSTENLVFSHSSSEDRERDRYNSRNRYRDKSDENRSDDNNNRNNKNNRFDSFRPSPPELSPPVFVDPDQDFFTSTIRNPLDTERSEEYQNSLPGFRPTRPRNRKRYRDEMTPSDTKDRRDKNNNNNNRYQSEEDEEYSKKNGRRRLEGDRDDALSKPVERDRDKDHTSDEQGIRDHRDRDRYRGDEDDPGRNDRTQDRPPPPTKYRPANSQENVRVPYSQKSDRILSNYPPSDDNRMPSNDNYNRDPMMNMPQGSENFPYFQPQQPFGSSSNELGQSNPNYPNNFNEQPQNNINGFYDPHIHPNTEYSPSKTQSDQFYPGGYDQHQFQHPFAEESHSVNSYHGGGGDENSWSNTYFILGGLIALSALTAFLLPTLLSSMGRNGKNRHDLNDDDLNSDFVDENTSTSTVTTSTSTPSSSDPTADADLWTEIKGVYNDVVNIVRGDYGGIVDKLTGSNKEKEKDGPNIVYRDEEVYSDEEDDERYEDVDITKLQIINRNRNKNKNKLRDRKGNHNNNNHDETDDDSSSNNNNRNKGSGGKTKRNNNNTKERTISSTINYVVKNNGYPVETSRGAPSFRNDTMAGFHLGNSSMMAATTESFMGEWAKVQLIGN